jgi:hypothetical protein
MTTKTLYQVAATNGLGVEDRITRPLPLVDARRICRERRIRAYARGQSRASAAKKFIVLAAD